MNRRREDDLNDEIRGHLEMARQDGHDPREFGNVTLVKETTRAMWGWTSLERLWQDLRYGARMLGRNPGFTAVAVLSLALGIGANTAIFTVIDALLLKTLPVKDPQELAILRAHDPARTTAIYHPLYVKFREQSKVFSAVAAILETERSNITLAHGAELGDVEVGLVSGNYFANLGVPAVIGRTFTLADDRVAGGHPVAVISYRFWERYFGLARDVLGKTLNLNGQSFSIVGVTARGFTGDWVGRPTDVWFPLMMHARVMPEIEWAARMRWGISGLERSPVRVIARLNPGTSPVQAQAATQVLFQQFLRDESGPNPSPERLKAISLQRIELDPAARGFSPQRDAYGQPLAILMAVVGLVLLIACANVANLLLVRNAARERELAVRLAIGASRPRIVRQLLTESVLLATLGGALGLLFASWGTTFLAPMIASGPQDSVRLDLQPDLRILTFTAGLCLVTGILFGLLPAFRSSRGTLASALVARGAIAGGSSGKLGRILVAAQVALSLILLIGAGLFAQTLRNLKSFNLGFDREHLLLVWTSPAQTGRVGQSLVDFSVSVREKLAALPGVVSVGLGNIGILNGDDMSGCCGRSAIAPRFFETVGVPLIAGRDITERDTEKSPHVVVIDETTSRHLFGNENPIGKYTDKPGDEDYPTQVVGLVKDASLGSPRGKMGRSFVPYRQFTRLLRATWCVVVRASGDPVRLASQVRHELRGLDSTLPIFKINTVDQQLEDVIVRDRLIAALAGFFGVAAVLLASIGLYGVMSYTTARRTQEIGIRLALGASRENVLSMVLRESLVLVGVGAAIGVPIALALGTLISSRLFGVAATDPITIIAATSLMISVAALASFLPARRASQVDPMIALRWE
jgi:predicted permease